MKKILKLLIATLVITFYSSSYAQLRIEIRQGIESPIIFASPLFSGNPIANAILRDVIESDLNNSGRFRILKDSEMISAPTQLSEVNLSDWRLVNADYLLLGQTEVDGANNYRTAFQLLDVINNQNVLGFRMPVPPEGLRAAGHRIADLIYENTLGVQGIFATRIAYVSQDQAGSDIHYQIVVADIDGTNPVRIIGSSEPLMSPTWSPDGRKIAYVSFENNRSEIYIQDVLTQFRERVSSRDGINGAPSFSPDGSKLAITLSQSNGNLDIYMINLDNQDLTRLTDSSAIDTEPTWSPDGDYIYFTSNRSGNPQIYRVEAELNGEIERITFEGSYNSRARISPDGETMVVVHEINRNFRIAIVDLDTRITQVLSDGQLDESPSFAPNGDIIMFATRERGVGVLSSVSVDGRIFQKIASIGSDVREPAWSPYAFR
jgi:TolB protein